MSREIIFRAWDKDNKSMSKPFSLEMGDQIAWRDVEIMQYTGLKDKNRVEIYEGDIVRLNPIPNYDHPRQVKWWKPFTGFVFAEPDHYANQMPLRISAFERKHIEVIGNIHETPELLKENT